MMLESAGHGAVPDMYFFLKYPDHDFLTAPHKSKRL